MSPMNSTIIALLTLAALATSGCERTQPKADLAPSPAASSATRRLLQESIEPTLVELPSQALPAWRQAGEPLPLLLFSNDPFLQSIPAELEEQAMALATRGSVEELTAFASYRRAAPRLLPFQTLRAALKGRLVSQLIWIFPNTAEGQAPDLETFRRQLVERGALSAEEAQSLRLEAGVIRGEIQGIPFQAGPLSAGRLPEGPCQVHIDLSYFTPLYKDEVRTPVFELLRQFCADLADAAVPATGVSLSYSTLEGLLPLDLRFLMANLASLMQAPQRLKEDLPSPWRERGDALYLATFMQTEKVLEKNLQALAAAPDDPAIHFDLYRSYRAAKNGEKALEHLAHAVRHDRGYAFEYLDLAATARERGEPGDVLEMLELARRALPEDPFIPMLLLEGQLASGDKAAARTLVRSLRGLPWSPVYFPGVPERLQQLASQADP